MFAFHSSLFTTGACRSSGWSVRSRATVRPEKEFAQALAQASQASTFTRFSPSQLQADPLPYQPIVPTTAAASVGPPTQHTEAVVSNGPVALPVVPNAGRRIRRTALVKRLCLALLLIAILLWILTAANPTLHPLFALAILLALVLWIAAYADHRRATEGPGAKQASSRRRKELS
jgi:hypothetical protein